MADTDNDLGPDEDFETEVETNQALEQGLGIGARELASIHESGADGTLDRDSDGVTPPDEDEEIGGAGRAQRKTI